MLRWSAAALKYSPQEDVLPLRLLSGKLESLSTGQMQGAGQSKRGQTTVAEQLILQSMDWAIDWGMHQGLPMCNTAAVDVANS